MTDNIVGTNVGLFWTQRLDVTAWASGPARAGGSCGNCDRRMIQMLAPAYPLSARDQIAPGYQLSALDHSLHWQVTLDILFLSERLRHSISL